MNKNINKWSKEGTKIFFDNLMPIDKSSVTSDEIENLNREKLLLIMNAHLLYNDKKDFPYYVSFIPNTEQKTDSATFTKFTITRKK